MEFEKILTAYNLVSESLKEFKGTRAEHEEIIKSLKVIAEYLLRMSKDSTEGSEYEE